MKPGQARPLRWRAASRGGVSVMAALLIATVAIAALVSIDVGHLFVRQRHLQKMVDLAAMSAAQQLKQAASTEQLSGAVLGTVSHIGAKNGYPAGFAMNCAEPAEGAGDTMSVCLGTWDPALGGPRHFAAIGNDNNVQPNAVRVHATQTVPLLFVFSGGGGRQLRAEAIANASPPAAAFSVGTGLLDVDTANSMLSWLLGNTVRLSAVDWQGLADATVTLDQLRVQAQVGTVDELLNTSLSLGDFYALLLRAASRDALLTALLGGGLANAGVGGVDATVSLGELLHLGAQAPVGTSAADVSLGVAELLLAAAQVARGDAAIALPVNVQLPLGLGGLSASVRIIEPPVQAAGPARKISESPVKWRTSATSQQIEVILNAKVSSGALGPLLGVELNVPVHLAVAHAQADLTALQCAAGPSDRRATIHVTPSLVRACLTNNCEGGEVKIGSASALLIPLLDLVVVDDPKSRSTAGQDVVLAPGQHEIVASPNPISGVFSQLLALQVKPQLLGVPLPLSVDLSPLLVPLGSALDNIVTPLLAGLGIQLGITDVWLHGIECNNAELVY